MTRSIALLCALLALSLAACDQSGAPKQSAPEPGQRMGAAVQSIQAGAVISQDTTWVSSQVSNADVTSSAANWTTCKTVWILLTIDGTSSPAGNVYVLTSVDNSDFTPKLIFDANKVYGATNGSAFSLTSAGAALAYTGSSTTTLNIPITDVPPYAKLFVDQSSGGTTGDRVNARWWCRSN